MRRKKILACFVLEWKRGVRLISSALVIFALMMGALGISTAVFCLAVQQKQFLPKVEVGLVIPDNDDTTKSLVRLIESMPSVRSISKFHLVSKKEADRGLAEGIYHAALYLTEDLYDDINEGRNTPLVVKTRLGDGIDTDLFRSLVESGVSFLQTAEASIYSVEEVSRYQSLTISQGQLLDQIALRYVNAALARKDLWNTTTLSAYGGISMKEFYLIAFLLSVLLLFGIGFAKLYSKEDRIVAIGLRRVGVGYPALGAAKVTAMTFVLWLILNATCLILYLTTDMIPFVPFFFLKTIPLVFSMVSFTHLIYSLIESEAASFFYLLMALFMFILAGGIIPSAFLPGFLQGIGRCLPVGAWQRYLAAVLWKGLSQKLLFDILLFAAAMFGLALVREMIGRWVEEAG
jgi:hypothetical protein